MIYTIGNQSKPIHLNENIKFTFFFLPKIAAQEKGKYLYFCSKHIIRHIEKLIFTFPFEKKKQFSILCI